MVTGHGAAGKYPLTGRLRLTRRHRLDKLHLRGGRSGVDNHRTELASPLLKLLNRALSSGSRWSPQTRTKLEETAQHLKIYCCC